MTTMYIFVGVLTLLFLIILLVPLRTIRLIGFQGAGARYKNLIDTEPLIYAGHVGIALDDNAIYAFTPYAPHLTYRELVLALQDEQDFPGIVQNDRDVFVRAVAVRKAGIKLSPVYEWRQPVTVWRWWIVRRLILRDVARSPMARKKRYSFPFRTTKWYNCATWPTTLRIDIPERSGALRFYIPMLKEKSGGREWQS